MTSSCNHEAKGSMESQITGVPSRCSSPGKGPTQTWSKEAAAASRRHETENRKAPAVSRVTTREREHAPTPGERGEKWVA